WGGVGRFEGGARVRARVCGAARDAVGDRTAHACSSRARVAGGARVPVVAGDRVVRVLAAEHGVAGVGGADVAVAAVDRGPDARRGAARARIARSADAVVVAGRARRVDLARRRAAVTVCRVAVVALLARLEGSVATELSESSDDGGEEIRLQGASGESRTVDAEEVLTTGA